MNIERKMKEYLSTLGFDVDGLIEFPKMKEVRSQFLKLALMKHPDKHNANEKEKKEKEMKDLLKAYKLVGKHIEEMTAEVVDDPEEEKARKHLTDFNWENINKQSISISILTMHASAWEVILENNYGKFNAIELLMSTSIGSMFKDKLDHTCNLYYITIFQLIL